MKVILEILLSQHGKTALSNVIQGQDVGTLKTVGVPVFYFPWRDNGLGKGRCMPCMHLAENRATILVQKGYLQVAFSLAWMFVFARIKEMTWDRKCSVVKN